MNNEILKLNTAYINVCKQKNKIKEDEEITQKIIKNTIDYIERVRGPIRKNNLDKLIELKQKLILAKEEYRNLVTFNAHEFGTALAKFITLVENNRYELEVLLYVEDKVKMYYGIIDSSRKGAILNYNQNEKIKLTDLISRKNMGVTLDVVPILEFTDNHQVELYKWNEETKNVELNLNLENYEYVSEFINLLLEEKTKGNGKYNIDEIVNAAYDSYKNNNQLELK